MDGAHLLPLSLLCSSCSTSNLSKQPTPGTISGDFTYGLYLNSELECDISYNGNKSSHARQTGKHTEVCLMCIELIHILLLFLGSWKWVFRISEKDCQARDTLFKWIWLNHSLIGFYIPHTFQQFSRDLEIVSFIVVVLLANYNLLIHLCFVVRCVLRREHFFSSQQPCVALR